VLEKFVVGRERARAREARDRSAFARGRPAWH